MNICSKKTPSVQLAIYKSMKIKSSTMHTVGGIDPAPRMYDIPKILGYL